MKIVEGMWAGDLEDILQPLVSIDEYESKIDDTAVAVGFFINDKDAADDLNRFIQRSAIPIIDSDVSPAPDQRGFYIVFAEMTNNDRFAENLTNLLDEIGQLSRITEWNMKIRGIKEIREFDENDVKMAMIRNRLSDRMKALAASIEDVKGMKKIKK